MPIFNSLGWIFEGEIRFFSPKIRFENSNIWQILPNIDNFEGLKDPEKS